MNKILVTGGAGFIGSNICVELYKAGFESVVIVENFCNSKVSVISDIEETSGKKPDVIECDLSDEKQCLEKLGDIKFDAVIHLAAHKAVGESVAQPLKYFKNNIQSLLNVVELAARQNNAPIVFSSSATVYGDPQSLPITENQPLSVTNPYGRTKLMGEEILEHLAIAESDWDLVALRYFNPVGAHDSGKLGDNPKNPSNLMPFVVQVAKGERESLGVFGDQYDTPDGTGVRDYIHVTDLARGHVATLEAIRDGKIKGHNVFNLGSGKGFSVLEIVKVFEDVNGVKVPYVVEGPRSGDIAACYADSSLAKEKLDWQTEKTLEDMCRDSWGSTTA